MVVFLIADLRELFKEVAAISLKCHQHCFLTDFELVFAHALVVTLAVHDTCLIREAEVALDFGKLPIADSYRVLELLLHEVLNFELLRLD